MNLLDLVKEKKMLIVAHRGTCGGNVPCNSMEAYQIALNHGADVIELDVDMSKDGVLYIQHPGMEHVHLGIYERITNYTSAEVEQMKLQNADQNKTQYSIPKLRDVLLFLKGKCIVNIDKFWEHPAEISALIRELDMVDYVLIKTEVREDWLNDVEKYAPDIPYMSIVRRKDEVHESLKKRNINYVGSEVLFLEESDEVCSDAHIAKMHEEGMIVWANSIVYNYLDVLSAGHTDDVSLVKGGEYGWGWIYNKGFDLIQTDFVLACKLYLDSIK